MVSTSKILTVSYGTFSCTLEGFDEPFNTMKSIAEYFRDLAADDRYFGAEPPTPDADMLHRIAEREIQKRVEARVENDEVVLRQADAAAPRIKPAAATLIPGETLLDNDAPAEPRPIQDAPQAALLVDAAPAEVAAPIQQDTPAASALPDDLPTDSIAAKLQRIRAVVDRGHEAEAASDYVEDQHAEPFFAPAQALSEGFEDVVEGDAPVRAPTEVEVAADLAADVATEEAAQDFVEDTRADADQDDVATNAQDASVAQDAAEEPEVTDNSSYDDAEDGAGTDDDAALAAVLGSITVSDAEPEARESDIDAAQDATDRDTDSDDAISAVMAGLAAHDAAEADALSDAETAETVADTADLILADETAEDWDVALGDDLEAALDTAIEGDEDENVFAEEEIAVEVAAETEAETAQEAAPRPVAIARVVKVKRADFTPVETLETQGNDDSMLTPEEEADLMAELAEVERDTVDEDEAPQRPAFEEAAGFDENDAAVDRILAETNTKMESTDVSRRRSAIAHLKAAVQATRADADAGDDAVDDDSTEAYRDDLARVVRPRRLGAGHKHAPRRLAPLMLVSEQRVDAPEAEQAVAVRPRRVTKGALALETEGEAEISPAVDGAVTFAAFADQVGAEGMGDLLEAAGAYATFIEGRPHFSRPQIMKLVLAHDPSEDFTREEGLRAFGKLMREGRIRKIKRGQFVLNEATRFRPDAQRQSA